MNGMSNELPPTLEEWATFAKARTYSPYSKFPVGAVIETESGEIFIFGSASSTVARLKELLPNAFGPKELEEVRGV